MLRKTVVLGVLGIGALLFLISSGRTADKAESKASFVHVVIFRVKADAPKGAAEGLVTGAYDLLKKIPTVRDVKAGKPADPATPDIAKKDYQVGLLVTFDDFNGLKTYLEHPLHTQYVERHGKNVDMDKLVVYDFVESRK